MIDEPMCSLRNCKHLKGTYQPEGDEVGEVPCCVAFPKGIPTEIAYGNDPHLTPRPGQAVAVAYEEDPELTNG